MDADKDGLISQEDFMKYLKSTGTIMSQREVSELF
jgi:Ca2+-binding EF-hand superfamily protein